MSLSTEPQRNFGYYSPDWTPFFEEGPLAFLHLIGCFTNAISPKFTYFKGFGFIVSLPTVDALDPFQ